MKWKDFIINHCLKQPYATKILNNLKKASQDHIIYPKIEQRFRCFKYFDIEDTKVVILGQDPYHTKDTANGLCFSVDNNYKPLPPSLINIFKALEYDLNIKKVDGDLEPWAKQGVLLLNTVLTVNMNQPNSHKAFGYEEMMVDIFKALSKVKNVVYMLWGKQAQSYLKYINTAQNLILMCPHPSPLSAHLGFIQNKHFSQANQYLIKNNRDPIKW
ncbi:uracil-DNA glycosylase [Ureaplasma diversum]|uniref:Uracil-DNA glycosylase n=1 Tax=Ureaplasma diversum NCTC 246 TaxID=1188241 RepID=A0A084F1N0_9BACT|nr:uracil-DNA glycosylase [Ureaplasma diversum]KEZ24122.1 Uracil-DNA glycosylase [Ureaplasma diversum NCTC 246]